MKPSLIAFASAIALATFAVGAIAADQTNPKPPGEGCDLRNTPGCKPGTEVTPAGKNDAGGPHGPSGNSGAGSSGNVDIQRAHNGGGDQLKATPKPVTPQ
jgi:hypothetical protein